MDNITVTPGFNHRVITDEETNLEFTRKKPTIVPERSLKSRQLKHLFFTGVLRLCENSKNIEFVYKNSKCKLTNNTFIDYENNGKVFRKFFDEEKTIELKGGDIMDVEPKEEMKEEGKEEIVEEVAEEEVAEEEKAEEEKSEEEIKEE